MEFLANPELWIALATLTALEIVLGIDNIIFISILVGKLPAKQQPMARRIGLAGAMLTRIALLFSLSLIMSLTAPLFNVPVIDHGVSGRDLILLIGGLFLIYKSVREIHEKTEGGGGHGKAAVATATFGATIVQVMILDIVFSLDSVITAVGMVNNMLVMVAAIVIAVGVMIAAAGPVSDFVHRHPTVKMLALAFLLLIGFVLIGEGAGLHIPKGYIYFAMAFSFAVEMLNIRMKSRSGPKS
ncbi:MAG: TerC family protein [Candidatus Melainabacteria bacterium]|nr:TerC family protein [Candidatus Melainabacteria bacterium]